MKTTFIVLCLILVGVIIAAPLLSFEQASAQMMMKANMLNRTGTVKMVNPNMMNLSFMNPGVMSSKNNPNIMNMMSMFANQNITGSIKLLPAMINGVRSQIKASLGDAVMTAQKEFGNNSQAVAANIGVEDGSLVYTIWGVDPDMNLHMVIIDPGNGKLLLSQKISLLQMMMGGMMNPGMMGGMMNPGMMGGMMNPGMMGGMMNPGIMSHMWR